MAFQNPWAWLGLLGLAVPIAVHLLRRRRAERVPFPTLRFLTVSPATAVRRHRLTDLPLLVIRLLIVGLAVVALAGPVRTGPQVRAEARGTRARAIVMDGSPALDRLGTGGVSGRTVAGRAIGALRAVDRTVTIEAPDLRAGFLSAVGWASRQTVETEVVVVSTFQVGELTQDDLTQAPRSVGLRFVPVPLSAPDHPSGAPLAVLSAGQARVVQPDLVLAPGQTSVSWERSVAAVASPLTWGGGASAGAMHEARAAADQLGVGAMAPDRPVRIEFGEELDRVAPARGSITVLTRPWMFEFVRALAEDSTLRAAARSAVGRTPPLGDGVTAVVINDHGGVVLAAGSDASTNPASLVLIAEGAPDVRLIAAVALAVPRVEWRANWPPLESTVVGTDELARWTRPPGAGGPAGSPAEGRPLGRWVWLGVLVLLGMETWGRRTAFETNRLVTKRVA